MYFYTCIMYQNDYYKLTSKILHPFGRPCILGPLPTPYAPPCIFSFFQYILVQRPLCTPPALVHIRYTKYTVQHILPAREQGSINFAYIKRKWAHTSSWKKPFIKGKNRVQNCSIIHLYAFVEEFAVNFFSCTPSYT